jgi:hypothetical protein
MKKKFFLFTHLIIALGFVSMIGLYPQTGTATSKVTVPADKETYTGNIIYYGGARGSATATFTLTIDNWTSDEDVLRVTGALKDGGQNALLKAIGKQKRGRIQIASNIGQDINAVWVSTGEEGERKITALAERWIGFFEARRGTRSLDYPFTYIQLFIDERGKGEGEMIPAAKVRYIGERTIEVENFGIYPARLTNIKRRK